MRTPGPFDPRARPHEGEERGLRGGPDGPRRVHLLTVGLPKSGTTTVASLFPTLRWGYERAFEARVGLLLRWLDAGGAADPAATAAFDAAWLGFDAAEALEVDAASFHHLAGPRLATLLPEARFLLLTRPAADWADSLLDMLLRHGQRQGETPWPAWQVGLGRRLAPSLTPAAFRSPAALAEALPTLHAELLRTHAAHAAAMAALPPGRALRLELGRLTDALPELAAFVGLPVDALDRARVHNNRAPWRLVRDGRLVAAAPEGAPGAPGAAPPSPRGPPASAVPGVDAPGVDAPAPGGGGRAEAERFLRGLWARGWGRHLAAHPELRPGRPELDEGRVELPIHGPTGTSWLRLRRLPSGGVAVVERLALPPALRPLAELADHAVATGLGWQGALRGTPLPSPRRLELFISSGCDLHCAFCCESERIARRSFMPWAELLGHLDRAAADGVQVLQFMGGEATLHPRFPDALRAARERGMRTYVITNLLRWSDRAFAEAVAPWLDEVMVSLHAGSEATGRAVTGRDHWWARVEPALLHARDTLRARVHASTVVTRASAPELERIADMFWPLRPQLWVLGPAVPIVGARRDALDDRPDLAELAAMRPRFEALSAEGRRRGCRLVWFCVPHCVLGPTLWDDGHDEVVDGQDLSDEADGRPEAVNFWARAEYLTRPRPVTLARTRPPACAGCARRDRCGGWFTDALARDGDAGLRAVREG